MTDKSSSQHIATLYRFCAQSMNYPDKNWFTHEYRQSLYELLDILMAKSEKDRIINAFSLTDNPLEVLQIEYTRLFINGVPHVIAPPYGSVYLDKTLQGAHTEKTLAFYKEHGFSLKDDADLPDHIIHQLEFLSLIAEQGDEKTEAEFLEKLFLPWFSRFYSRVKHESNHPFYSVIVQLIDYLTKEEDEHGIQLNEA